MDGFLVRTGLLIHLIFLSTCGFEPLEWSAKDYESEMENFLEKNKHFLTFSSLEMDQLLERFVQKGAQEFVPLNAKNKTGGAVFSALLSSGNYSLDYLKNSFSDFVPSAVIIKTYRFDHEMKWIIPSNNFSVKWDDVQRVERSLSFIDFLHANYFLYFLMSRYYGVGRSEIDQDKLDILFRRGLLKGNNKNFVMSDSLKSLIDTFYLRPITLKSFFENFYQEIIITDNKSDPDKISASLYLGAMSLAQKAGWDAEKHSQEDFYTKQTLKNGPFSFGMPQLLKLESIQV